MQGRLEKKILRALAVMALVTAALGGIFILADSGVIGGGEGGDGSQAPSAVTDATPPAGEAAAPEEPVIDQPTGSTTPTTSQKTYTVKEGDSFATIAEENNTTIAQIQELNPTVNPNNMHQGDILKLP